MLHMQINCDCRVSCRLMFVQFSDSSLRDKLAGNKDVQFYMTAVHKQQGRLSLAFKMPEVCLFWNIILYIKLMSSKMGQNFCMFRGPLDGHV